MPAWPVEIRAHPNVNAGARVFRHQERSVLTVVVKATFAFAPDAPMTVAPPQALVTEDRPFEGNPTRSIEAAHELAPYLARCDVLFTGYAALAAPAAASAVRVAVFGATPLVDKTVHVFGDVAGSGRAPFTRMPLVYERARGGPGVEANPLGTEQPNLVDPKDPTRPAAFGPVSPFWPVRKRLLGADERRELAAQRIPEGMPWDYFQAAPPDQQANYLRGGEWIVLDGVSAARPRVQTQLPEVRAVALWCEREHASPKLVPIDLVADMLVIDGERERCSVVWRGRHPLESHALDGHFVAAALAAKHRPVDWTKLMARGTEARTPIAARAEAPAPESTMEIAEGGGRGPALPFTASSPAAARPATPQATPWAATPLVAPPKPVVGEATLDERAGSAEETIAITGGAPPRSLAPFRVASPGAAATPASTSATPWGSSPIPRAPAVGAGEETMTLANLAQLPPVPAAQPRAVSPPMPAAPPATPAPAPPRVPQAVKKAAPPAAPEAGPPSLGTKLRTAGADAKDVAALLRALKPPPPPPDDDG